MYIMVRTVPIRTAVAADVPMKPIDVVVHHANHPSIVESHHIITLISPHCLLDERQTYRLTDGQTDLHVG